MAKKPKKNIKRIYRSQAHKVNQLRELLYSKISIKWLPRTDEYQIYLDLKLNGTRLIMLGSIDPDNSYYDGMRIYCTKPLPWMTCNELQLSRKDAPNFFVCILGYVHTIGDLLNDGADIESLPTASAYNDGKAFTDSEFMNLFKFNEPLLPDAE